MALRHAHPAVRSGDYHQVYAQDRQFAFVRRNEQETLLIVLNASDDPAEVSVPVGTHIPNGVHPRPLFGDLTVGAVGDGMITIRLPARSGGVMGNR
ncbi:MAG: DUF3459 domain-containing protein [Planctomycetaceae bacterium]|nr:DUF3459 domain-containing protein [Planctomycetaceae bacterium]